MGKIYKLRRRSDELFFGAGRRVGDNHDHCGRFYSKEATAVDAIEMSGRQLADYDLVIYEVVEVGVVSYAEVLSEG